MARTREVVVIHDDDDDDEQRASRLAPTPQKHGVRDVVVLIDDDDDDDHRAFGLAPSPQQHGVVVDQHGERRAVAFAGSPPPKWRPRLGGIFLGRREDHGHRDERCAVAASPPPEPIVGGPSLRTTLRPQSEEVLVPSDAPRFPFGTPHPQQRGFVDERRAVAVAASAPPNRRPSGGGSSLATMPRAQAHPHQSASPPPGGILLGRHESCGFSLPTAPCTFDTTFLTPPPAPKPDSFGVRESRRVLFFTPPAAAERRVPVFRDPFEDCADEDEDEDVSVMPPPKLHPLQTTPKLPYCNRLLAERRVPVFKDPFEDCADEDEDNGGVSILPSPMPDPIETTPKLPSCNRPAGGRSSSCVQGGSTQGQCAGSAGGRSGARVQVGPGGRGSRARALAELLGDADRQLKPDNGPTDGQDLKEWQFERNLDLHEEFEYLDGLLTRINKLPQGRRISALARKGWVQFYTRLEVCMVVRRQMREAKADPAPVPKRLMAEVR